MEVRLPHYNFVSMEFKAVHSGFTDGDRAAFFFPCGIWVEYSRLAVLYFSIVLKFSLLLGFLFTNPLAREDRLLLGHFCLYLLT